MEDFIGVCLGINGVLMTGLRGVIFDFKGVAEGRENTIGFGFLSTDSGFVLFTLESGFRLFSMAIAN